MKLLSPDILEPELLTMNFVQPDIVACGELSQNKIKPYIKGHITNGDSTFTFNVNNQNVTVPVGADGNWKWVATTTVTSAEVTDIADSLVLFGLNGVTQLNVDYPIQVTFNKCDATTESALNYIYHIRGTATGNFQFNVGYITDAGTADNVTENALIDLNGEWDVSYSGKKIRRLHESFYQNTLVTEIEFTENFDKCLEFNSGNLANGAFRGCTALKKARFHNAVFGVLTKMANAFRQCAELEEVDFSNATFENLESMSYVFTDTPKLKEFYLQQGTLSKVTTEQSIFDRCYALKVVSMPKATLQSCESIFRMFEDCTSLETIDLKSATIGATNTTDAFRNATSLKNIDIENIAVSLNFGYSSILTAQSVINIFNAVAADGITLTFHSTVYAMIQAQLAITDSPIYTAYYNKIQDYNFTIASA